MGKQAEGNGARRRQRRSFTAEFKAEVIALVRRGERSLPAICRELDLSEDGSAPLGRAGGRGRGRARRVDDRGARGTAAVAAGEQGPARGAGHLEAGGLSSKGGPERSGLSSHTACPHAVLGGSRRRDGEKRAPPASHGRGVGGSQRERRARC